MVFSKFRIEIYLGVITLEPLVKDVRDVISNMNSNVQFVVSNKNFVIILASLKWTSINSELTREIKYL